MRNSKKIVVGAAAILIGAATWLFTREESLEPLENKETHVALPAEQEKKTLEGEKASGNEAARTEVNEKIASQEEIQAKYHRFLLSGLVRQNQIPLSNVNIEARVAYIVGDSPDRWKATTDNQGRFTVAVPSLTAYDIEARYTSNVGMEKKREVTHAPGDDILILFKDSPDIQLTLGGNDSIKRATLEAHNKKTLEGIVRGNAAFFEDVTEQTLYTMFLETENHAVIQDQIPVFDNDVERKYVAPQTIRSRIQIKDARERTGVAGAEITMTLPDIDLKIFANKGTTNQDGIWVGWLTPTTYTLQVHANGYVGREVENMVLGREGNATIFLDKGVVLKGKVVDQQNRNIAGAEVYLLDPLDLSPYKSVKPVTTNAAGEFEVRGIDPNRPSLWGEGRQAYVPVAVKRGYMQLSLDTILFNQSEGTIPEKEIRVELAETTERLEGRVTDAQNKPVQAWLEVALVNLKGSGNVSNAPFWQKKSFETKPDGSFIMTGMAPGTYSIAALPGKDEKESMTTKRKVTIPTDPIQIILEQGVPLEGRVLQYNGEVAKEVNLMFSKESDQWQGYTRTNSEGRFNIVVPQGPAKYYAWWKNAERKNALEEQAGHLDISGRGEHKILLGEKKYLAMQVSDAATKQPIPCYTASFVELSGQRRVIRREGFDQQGIMYFPLQETSFPLRLVVEAQGYVGERKEIKGKDYAIAIALKKKE